MIKPPQQGHKTIMTVAEAIAPAVDAKDDPRQLHNLDYPTWLPFASKTYEISSDINDYVLVSTPICPTDIPNRNGIGFPLNEITKFLPPPTNRMAYKAWKGCPGHYEHKNDIHTDAYGVILDTSLHKVLEYGQGKLWKVMGLLAIDKKKYPVMAARVMNGDVNTYSMGAMVEAFSCSYCGTPMIPEMVDQAGRKHPARHCSHINPKNDIDWNQVRDFDGSQHVAFRNAHGIQPAELSIVESPAWPTALSDHILNR